MAHTISVGMQQDNNQVVEWQTSKQSAFQPFFKKGESTMNIINSQPKAAKKLSLNKETIRALMVEQGNSAQKTPTRDGC